jgi:TonB-linked SusC/RagA family outer membrane protein
MGFSMPRSIAVVVASATLLATTAPLAAAQSGSITGKITAVNGQVLPARILVVGTNLTTQAGPDGRYTVRNVPPGTAEVRAMHIGYQAPKKSVRVVEGQEATLDFEMTATAVELTEVVITATGEQRRVEVGNAVANIAVGRLIETAPVRSLAEVLAARSPGVMVTQGTQTGAGQRIRIRGVSSLALSNEPIFVIDGQRMTSDNGSTQFGNGGNNFSRLGDINPEDIDNIEIVKGPSAATLYGTDAANGVILITTKKGRTGQARWNAYYERGLLQDRNWYSDNYTLAGVSPTGAPLILSGQCRLIMVSLGTCMKTGLTPGYDSLRVFNPITNSETTPLGNGYRTGMGLQVSGGSEAVRYFLSAGSDDEIGVFKLDPYEERRFQSLNIEIHPWQQRPNTRLLRSFRGSLSAQVNPKFDAALSFGYTYGDGYTSNESNNTVGIGSQAFGGPGYRNNGTVAGLPDSLIGYRAGTPGLVWAEKLQQKTHRMILGTNFAFRPTAWLQTRANLGTDLTGRVDSRLHMNGEGWPLTATYRDGQAFQGRTNINNLSADLSATANYNPKKYEWLALKTTLGTQYNAYLFDQNQAGGTTLPPGATTSAAGATPSVGEGYTTSKTLGVFIEEGIAIRDRLFITGAVRTDQNSAFGQRFQQVFYPKVSFSWVASEELFFPRTGVFGLISDLRLRLSTGSSGVQPGPNDARRTFVANSASIKAVDTPIETFQAIGNDSLKPERSTEWETGFDSRWWDNRIQLDVTYYSRLTKDALINAVIAPSLGSGSTSQRTNLGAVKNAGYEVTVGGRILDTRAISAELLVAASTNANKVISLGSTPPQIGVTNWTVAGYPIGGIWAQPIMGWNDINGDGILTVNEVTIKTDTLFDDSIDPITGLPKHSIIGIGSFRGYPQPRHLVTVSPVVELFDRKLRISSLFDYRGGNKHYNNTERIRCTRPNCNGMFNPNASFEEQAMVVASINAPQRTLDGYYQPGGFVKWRELAASYDLPTALLTKTRARSANVVLSVRNLKLWTKYRGTDPESDFTATGGGDTPSEFQTFGSPTLFQMRLNFTF